MSEVSHRPSSGDRQQWCLFWCEQGWAWEECTFAIRMSPLLHCMQCRSDYLKSKPWESPSPSFSAPAFCSVCAVLFPDFAALADENLTCIVYDMHWDFTSVSVSITSCDSHKNLGRSSAPELAEHCRRRPDGAQRGQGTSRVPQLKSSLHPPAVW